MSVHREPQQIPDKTPNDAGANNFEVWSTGTESTILEVFARALARSGPEFEFIDYSARKFTLGYLDRESTRLAHGLQALGVKHGECIVSLLDNCIEQILLMLATSKIGAINVPINTAYKGEFLRHQINDSATRLVIAENLYAERVIAIESEIDSVEVLLIKEPTSQISGTRISTRPFTQAFSDQACGELTAPRPGDLAMLIYTGGTTGLSKGCMISHNYVCNLARQIGSGQGISNRDVIWTPLPGFHLNMYTATVIPALLFGAKAAIYPRFSVSNFWPEILRTRATTTNLLSTMLQLVADAPDSDAMASCHGQIRLVGGAPFPPPLQEKWKERFGVKYAATGGYGLSECAMVTSIPVTEYRPPGTSGRRNDIFDVRIVDDNDHELPPNTPGEVIVRPRKPHVMFEGYWNRPADTQKAMRNMWFHTGDIGKFDADGFFYFVDRKKDYLRRRGENISSMEVEAVFRKHPAIAEVAVHAVFSGIEDDLKVTATLRAGISVGELDLCRWSTDHLPYFAVPRYVEFRSELPKNPVGRVLKYQLRDEGVTPATWDREKSDFTLLRR